MSNYFDTICWDFTRAYLRFPLSQFPASPVNNRLTAAAGRFILFGRAGPPVKFFYSGNEAPVYYWPVKYKGTQTERGESVSIDFSLPKKPKGGPLACLKLST